MEEQLLTFSFRHGRDWTRLTNRLHCSMESLSWHPNGTDFNYEIILAKWADKRTSIDSFFRRQETIGLINELISCEPIFPNVYMVSFTGPFHNTVRENLLKYNLTTYSSSVKEGVQKWNVLIRPRSQFRFIRSLMDIGNFTVNPTLSAVSSVDMSRIMWANQLLSKLSRLVLTDKEIEYLMAAGKLGYFNKRRNLSVTDMAALLSRNKSTVDRSLKSAIGKLLSCIIASMNEAN
ncbi:MAG: helix-turn-helix domain-containing protein [Thermoplasmata archaeon]|uniref:Helix-turn-helix domain-containing protein n=1 Tax=Candidatus Sysuiplasma superficiale TaxID=2823368 RepID=A0A8J8CH03_9ARCH|nr:helix-turn-helix domain-containing protein [Candidatus Sysuiplasma superficiale]MBX8644951.1 helix-turn-helix domain-containing protein [Candidatus Sysuiplasma superficiale]